MTSLRIIDHPGFSMDPNGSTGGGIISPERLQAAEAADKLAQIEANKVSRPLQQEAAQMQIEQARRGVSVETQNEFVEKGITTGRGTGIMQFISVDRPAMLADIRAKNQAGDTEGARAAYARLRELTDQVGPGLSAVANYSGANPLVSAMATQAKNASMYLLGDDQAEHQKEMDLLDERLNPNAIPYLQTQILKEKPFLTPELSMLQAKLKNGTATVGERAKFTAIDNLGGFGGKMKAVGASGKLETVETPSEDSARDAVKFLESLAQQLQDSGVAPEEAYRLAGDTTKALVETGVGKDKWGNLLIAAQTLTGPDISERTISAIRGLAVGFTAVMNTTQVKGPNNTIYVNTLTQPAAQEFTSVALKSAVEALAPGFQYTPVDSAQRASAIAKIGEQLALMHGDFVGMGIDADMALDANARYAGEIAAYRTGLNRSVLSDGAKTLLAKLDQARERAGAAPVADPMNEALGASAAPGGLLETATETMLQRFIMRAVATREDSTPAGAVAAVDEARDPIAQYLATTYGTSVGQMVPLADAYIAAKKLDPNVTLATIGAKLIPPPPAAKEPVDPVVDTATGQSSLLEFAARPLKTSDLFDDRNRAEIFTKGLADQFVAPTGPMTLNNTFTLGDVKNPKSPATAERIEAFLSTKVIPSIAGMSELVSEKPEVKEALRQFITQTLVAHRRTVTKSAAFRQADLELKGDESTLGSVNMPITPTTFTTINANEPDLDVIYWYADSKSPLTSLNEAIRQGDSFSADTLGKAVKAARAKRPAPVPPEEVARAKQADQAKVFGDTDAMTLDAATKAAGFVKERMNLALTTALTKTTVAACEKTIAYLLNVAPAEGIIAQATFMKMVTSGKYKLQTPADQEKFLKDFNINVKVNLDGAAGLIETRKVNAQLNAMRIKNGEEPVITGTGVEDRVSDASSGRN